MAGANVVQHNMPPYILQHTAEMWIIKMMWCPGDIVILLILQIYDLERLPTKPVEEQFTRDGEEGLVMLVLLWSMKV